MQVTSIKCCGIALSVLAVFFITGLGLTLATNVIGGEPNTKVNNAPVCPGEVHGYTRCHARVVVDSKGNPLVTTSPNGYGPAQFRGAYGLSGTASSSSIPIIAIVDAYDQPYILSDLNTYSSTFGVPGLPACSPTSPPPCFKKVDQNGGTSYPQVNSGWALEISLDVEIAHAICQNCSILLVEAYSSSYSDLMAAVDRARLMGATVISNSYGSSEFSSESAYDSHFSYTGIAITFSSGDSGYGTSYPAASPYVTAVGGTTLNISGTSYISESAWSGAGSGCSAYETKPSWQTDTGCSKRTIADVSADADPNTGAAVYDSVRYQGLKGWFKVGGTSLSSPIIASTYALAGGVSAGTWGNSIPYSLGIYLTNLRDITSGSNGTCGTYLCTAVKYYDGPTGLGTPYGTGAFK
jgi:subtilase family serine protease